MIVRNQRGWLIGVLLAAALIAAACLGGNPNETVEADEFFRPPGPTAAQVPERDGSDSQPAEAEQAPSDDPEPDTRDEPSRPDTPATTGDDLELADDIVRRYLNAAYGYSLELVCGPFCNATSNALDRVGFLSDQRDAVINIDVLRVDPDSPPRLQDLEAIWAARNVDNDSFAIVTREETVLPADGVSPALLFEWTIDRRVGGGFQERYKSLITVVGPIAYFLNAGGIADSFDSIESSLNQALNTFLARTNPPGLPGVFTRWGFSLPYNVEAISGEFGNRTPTPNFDSGVFVQQSNVGQLQILLIWESLSQVLFDPDIAIDDALAPPAGGQIVESSPRTVASVDGVEARVALADSTDANGTTTRVVVYSWYCGDSGRSFVLQSFDLEDPVAQLATALADFRCAAP